MQLTQTHVGNATDGMITVEFQGEGGELVSVKMAAYDNLQRDAIVNRAKAMMVQLTTFAGDRDPSEDGRSHSSDDSEQGRSKSSEAKSELPVASSFGEAPSSAA